MAGYAGAVKTLIFVLKGENQADVSNLADTFVKKGSVVCAVKAMPTTRSTPSSIPAA